MKTLQTQKLTNVVKTVESFSSDLISICHELDSQLDDELEYADIASKLNISDRRRLRKLSRKYNDHDEALGLLERVKADIKNAQSILAKHHN